MEDKEIQTTNFTDNMDPKSIPSSPDPRPSSEFTNPMGSKENPHLNSSSPETETKVPETQRCKCGTIGEIIDVLHKDSTKFEPFLKCYIRSDDEIHWAHSLFSGLSTDKETIASDDIRKITTYRACLLSAAAIQAGIELADRTPHAFANTRPMDRITNTPAAAEKTFQECSKCTEFGSCQKMAELNLLKQRLADALLRENALKKELTSTVPTVSRCLKTIFANTEKIIKKMLNLSE